MRSGKIENRKKKLAILKIIKENKKVLFGTSTSRNNPSNKKEKEEAWKEVLKTAQSLDVINKNRNWTYARDHIFGLWKSRALAKWKKSNKLNTCANKMNAVDQAIYDIINICPNSNVEKSSELIHLESDGTLSSTITEEHKEENSIKITNEPDDEQNSETHSAPIKEFPNEQSIHTLEKELLKTKIYKNKLIILQMEQNLQLPPSKFTKEFYVQEQSVEPIKIKKFQNCNF